MWEIAPPRYTITTWYTPQIHDVLRVTEPELAEPWRQS